jgi:hypothetical protein
MYRSAMEITYKCSKCLGTDYYMSTRNVTTGYGWGIRGKMKDFPVCRNCDEIMHYMAPLNSRTQRDIEIATKFFSRVSAFIHNVGKIGNRKAKKQDQFWRGLLVVTVIVGGIWGLLAAVVFA